MVKDREGASRVLRFAPLGVAAFSGMLVVVQVGWVTFATAADAPDYTRGAWALAATACLLVLHLGHVYGAARGSSPVGAGWSLAVLAIVVIGALPLIGSLWLPTFYVLAVSALIVLRPPWSLLMAAAVVLAPAPVAMALGDEAFWATWYVIAVVFRGSAVFALVWLVGAMRQVQAARTALAEAAVAVERLRIDEETRRKLGAALDSIVARGQQMLVEEDLAVLEGKLRALVDGSRHMLAEARQLLSGYRRTSMLAELDTAVSLLTAAGIKTEIVASRHELSDTVDASALSSLRSAVADLLRDHPTERCVVAVTVEDGQPRVALHTEAADPAMSAGAS